MKKASLWSALMGALAWFLLPPSSSRATLIDAMSLEDLTNASSDVVEVEAISKTSHRINDGTSTTGAASRNDPNASRIVTDIEVQAMQIHRGTLHAGERFTLRVLGGSDGQVALRVAGEASMEVGERAFLFGDRVGIISEGRAMVRSVGMSQGCMRIEERSGQSFVVPNTHDLSLVRRDARGVLRPAEPALSAPTALPSFRTQIRSLVARSGARR